MYQNELQLDDEIQMGRIKKIRLTTGKYGMGDHGFLDIMICKNDDVEICCNITNVDKLNAMEVKEKIVLFHSKKCRN